MTLQSRIGRVVFAVIVSLPIGTNAVATDRGQVPSKAANPNENREDKAEFEEKDERPRDVIPFEKPGSGKYEMHDIHFHLTNYVHEGITAPKLLEYMGDRVGRSTLFGIPLSQRWDFYSTGKRRPGYYLESDSEMYYYSFIDAIIAAEYLRLSEKDQARIDPFIVGFNPTDMNGKDHIRNVLKTFPGVFVGIGEFSIHKEMVSSKVSGTRASINNPALDEILKFATEVGLVVMLHCDIDEMRTAGDHPAHVDALRNLFARHPGASIIYAHTGLGRFVEPKKNHVKLLDEMCRDETLKHVNFDISWDETAKWIVNDPNTLQSWVELINRHPTRFLFGSDAVAPKSQAALLKTWNDYAPLFARLTPEASKAVRLGNYERIIDAGRIKVRAWEARNVRNLAPLEAASTPQPSAPDVAGGVSRTAKASGR